MLAVTVEFRRDYIGTVAMPGKSLQKIRLDSGVVTGLVET
jgi:hypothetical protein